MLHWWRTPKSTMIEIATLELRLRSCPRNFSNIERECERECHSIQWSLLLWCDLWCEVMRKNPGPLRSDQSRSTSHEQLRIRPVRSGKRSKGMNILCVIQEIQKVCEMMRKGSTDLGKRSYDRPLSRVSDTLGATRRSITAEVQA